MIGGWRGLTQGQWGQEGGQSPLLSADRWGLVGLFRGGVVYNTCALACSSRPWGCFHPCVHIQTKLNASSLFLSMWSLLTERALTETTQCLLQKCWTKVFELSLLWCKGLGGSKKGDIRGEPGETVSWGVGEIPTCPNDGPKTPQAVHMSSRSKAKKQRTGNSQQQRPRPLKRHKKCTFCTWQRKSGPSLPSAGSIHSKYTWNDRQYNIL